MLLGEYIHAIDEKKRLTLPRKFKEGLGKKVVLTRGLDNCLFIYPEKEWTAVAGKLKTLSFTHADTRGFNRFMFSGAAEIDVDSAGRILIPESLKKFAKLSEKVVLVGVSDRVEVWDENSWIKYTQDIESNAEKLAEKLGEIGVL